MRTVIAIMAVVGIAGAARAQPSRGDAKARAEAEASAGQHLYDENKFDEAAPHFVAAYEIDHQPAYLFDAAQAYRFAKACANAAKYFRQFLDAAKQVQAENLDKVTHYLDEMDVCVKAEAAASKPVTPPDIPRHAEPVPAPAAPPPAVPSARERDPGRTQRRISYALGAAGVLGVALGGYYTHRVGQIHDEAQAWASANCMQGRPCSAGTLAMQQAIYNQRGNDAEQREIIGYAAGGAALAGAVVMFALSRSSGEHAVAAAPTPGGAVVTAGFRF